MARTTWNSKTPCCLCPEIAQKGVLRRPSSENQSSIQGTMSILPERISQRQPGIYEINLKKMQSKVSNYGSCPVYGESSNLCPVKPSCTLKAFAGTLRGYTRVWNPAFTQAGSFYRAFVDKEFIGLNFQTSTLTSYISFAEEKRHGYVKTGFAGFWPLFSIPAFSFFPAGSFDYSDFCGLVLLGSLFLNLIRMNFLLSDLEIFSLYQAAAKIVLLIWIVRYNIRHKVQTADNDYNRFWYFVSFLFLILFFGLLFFLFKEWVGLLANFAITSLSGKVSIDVLSFFIFRCRQLSLPPIFSWWFQTRLRCLSSTLSGEENEKILIALSFIIFTAACGPIWWTGIWAVCA